MDRFVSILPGARVRNVDGFIGTVERLEHQGADAGDWPDVMVVRADDGRWRYRIPVLLVQRVTQGTFHTLVQLALPSDQLVRYVAERLEQPVRREPAGAPAANEAPAANQDEVILRIPVAVEELVAQKRPVVRSIVHVHKGVAAVEERFTVPLYHEEAIIERIPLDHYDRNAPANPNEAIIPIVEERLVVRKESVIKEYLRVRKTLVAEQQEVYDTVRHEFVQVTERQADAGGASGGPPLRDTPPSQEAL